MSTKPYYQPKLLKTLLFDINEAAAFVELDLAHLLRKPVEGVYSRSTGRLLINSQECGMHLLRPSYYYHDRVNHAFTPVDHPINCVGDIRGPVYDASLNVLITSTMLNDAKTFLTEMPSVPVIGLQVVELFVTHYINKRLRWQKLVGEVWFDLTALMQDEWRDPYNEVSDFEYAEFGRNASTVVEETHRRIGYSLEHLLEMIDSGLDCENSEWAIVHVKRSMSRLRIQVFEDYRICEWMNEHDQGRNMQSLMPSTDVTDNDIAMIWRG